MSNNEDSSNKSKKRNSSNKSKKRNSSNKSNNFQALQIICKDGQSEILFLLSKNKTLTSKDLSQRLDTSAPNIARLLKPLLDFKIINSRRIQNRKLLSINVDRLVSIMSSVINSFSHINDDSSRNKICDKLIIIKQLLYLLSFKKLTRDQLCEKLFASYTDHLISELIKADSITFSKDKDGNMFYSLKD